jgi:hypothetical protein
MTLLSCRATFSRREMLPSFDVSLARDWLRSCLSSHKCDSLVEPSSIAAPSQVVQILQRAEDLGTRLISLSKKQNVEYAALSYRCSDEKEHITLGRNLQTYEKSIPLDSLPATTRDAVSITTALDLQYLWVECLCTVQKNVPRCPVSTQTQP